MHVKRLRKKSSKIKIYIVFVLILISLLFILIGVVGERLSGYYLEYSKREAIEIMDSALNKTVNKDILNEIKNSDFYIISKNKDGDIETIDYNSYLVNNLLNKMSTNLYNIVKQEERSSKDASFYIPLGAISKNPLLVDKGPKIPVRMHAIGSVISNINTKVKDFGINNSLIEMSVHVEVTEKVILPVISDEIKISNDIPLAYKIIKGKIPNYYGGIIDRNSNVYSIPVE